jgi:hypothetical protein
MGVYHVYRYRLYDSAMNLQAGLNPPADFLQIVELCYQLGVAGVLA